MDLGRYKIVKDPVYGYVRLYEHELGIVDTLLFQRLRRVKQLGAAHLVYPGAQHTRFEHSIGTAFIAEEMVRSVLGKAGIRGSDLERYVVISRVVALLHDIGHGPYSHTFEEYVLYPRNLDHEVMASRLLSGHEELAGAVERIVSEYGYGVDAIAAALSSKSVEEWPFREAMGDAGDERALFYIFKGAFCSDLIDYLLRDSYFSGAGYADSIDWRRLIHFMELRGPVVAVDERALEVLDQVLIARLFMFSTVYYHKKVRAAEKVVGMLLQRYDEELGFDSYVEDPEAYQELDDYYVLGSPSVRGWDEARWLLSRNIPFKAVEEYKLLLPRGSGLLESLVGLSRRYLEQALEEALRRRGLELVAGKDFFVDTPKLPLNPMLSDEEVFIVRGGEVVSRNVTELTWLHAPSSIAVVRLYVNRRTVGGVKEVVDEFLKLMRGTRSFY